MNKKNTLMTVMLLFVSQLLSQQESGDSIVWMIDNLTSIGGNPTTILGSPVVVESDLGPCVEFDGIDDGLIVDANPVAGAESFTVEVVFKPYASDLAANVEQRFVHMQESDNRRLLIELRLAENNQWFLDTFIKNYSASRVLYAENIKHPIGGWQHAALVYENDTMRHFVNRNEELSGEIKYAPMQSGQTSIGVRLNQVSWYKGAIRMLRVTHRALEPSEFLDVQTQTAVFSDFSNEFQPCRNYPNPFNPSTTIHYSLPRFVHVLVSVYNVMGQHIRTLVDTEQAQGQYEIVWDGMNQENRQVDSGIYFIKIKYRNQIITKKMMMIQ